MYGVGIVLDVHAAPGAQNPLPPASPAVPGVSLWGSLLNQPPVTYVQQTIKFVEVRQHKRHLTSIICHNYHLQSRCRICDVQSGQDAASKRDEDESSCTVAQTVFITLRLWFAQSRSHSFVFVQAHCALPLDGISHLLA